jgi:hypothetical protein
MSGLDIFAWIVLVILASCAIAVFCIAGWLPGHIAKTRGHPQAQAVTVAGSTGTAAIFTEAVKATHVIRKVLLRQLAILNYVNPFLGNRRCPGMKASRWRSSIHGPRREAGACRSDS